MLDRSREGRYARRLRQILTSCFPEIAGDAGIYFDPYSETSILESIKEVIYDDRKRTELIMRGRERLKLYSWEKATALTQKTYLKALNME